MSQGKGQKWTPKKDPKMDPENKLKMDFELIFLERNPKVTLKMDPKRSLNHEHIFYITF